jgi:hypothetical protein
MIQPLKPQLKSAGTPDKITLLYIYGKLRRRSFRKTEPDGEAGLLGDPYKSGYVR